MNKRATPNIQRPTLNIQREANLRIAPPELLDVGR